MKINERIYHARQISGMTQAELGCRVGASQSSVGRWEKGEQCPSGEMLVRLAKEFNIPLAEFIDVEIDMPSRAKPAVDDKNLSFGERLTAARKFARLTQKELADLLDVNQGSVSRWEKGEQQPTADILFRLAQILNFSLDELIPSNNVDKISQIDPVAEVSDKPMDETFDLRLTVELYEYVKNYVDTGTTDELEAALGLLKMIESRIKLALRIRGAPYERHANVGATAS